MDPVAPGAVAQVLHEFAFNLGMDLMKRDVGRSAQMGNMQLAAAQAALLPIGDTLYSLIVQAQSANVAATDIDKLLNNIDNAISKFEAVSKKT
jgi:hypothetical protein